MKHLIPYEKILALFFNTHYFFVKILLISNVIIISSTFQYIYTLSSGTW
jgi:hypothetical protein